MKKILSIITIALSLTFGVASNAHANAGSPPATCNTHMFYPGVANCDGHMWTITDRQLCLQALRTNPVWVSETPACLRALGVPTTHKPGNGDASFVQVWKNETITDIALGFYQNASMWRLIAFVNGLNYWQKPVLHNGQILFIPGVAQHS